MTIAEKLEEQMKRSAEFTKNNFGLQLGSDYPEIAREVLKSQKVCGTIASQFVILALSSGEVIAGFRAKDMAQSIAGDPRVYNQAMQFLYWGIQVGRELERESAEVLRKMEAT